MITTVEKIGDDVLTQNIINRSIDELYDNTCTKIGRYAFYDCEQLTYVNCSLVTDIEESAFQDCINLKTVDFTQLNTIALHAFDNCDLLAKIIIRNSDEVVSCNCTLPNKFSAGTGYIYVPSAIVDSYKSDTSWGNYAGQIRAIEDYPVIYNKYSWDSVKFSIASGTYAEDYSVGDEIPIDLGSEGTINMQVAGFDHDDLADGSGKSHITFISKEALQNTQKMNESAKTWNGMTTENAGGWSLSDLRTYCNDTILNLIPEALRSDIKEVNKISDGGRPDATLITTTDKIWCPSCVEVGCTFSDTLLLGQGSKYDLFNSAADRKKVRVGTTMGASWWVRSTYPERDNVVYIVAGNGSFLNVDATASYYVVFGFCL